MEWPRDTSDGFGDDGGLLMGRSRTGRPPGAGPGPVPIAPDHRRAVSDRTPPGNTTDNRVHTRVTARA
ncbi:hypothetical protein GCM10009613_01360 [Pseudonocardia kongjuensis]|uniref:Uncharacterized protein n=1 Tax=Pseudonocardia kongjuensis TaxID=102227 RepID=A0ABN1XG51_9PSEU